MKFSRAVIIRDVQFNTPGVNPKAFTDLCLKAAGDIRVKIRTALQAGNDPSGNPMPALSEEYKAHKEASGRKGVRDLNWTGGLLNSMKTRVPEDGKPGAELFFLGSNSAAKPQSYAQIAAHNEARSPWFYVSDAAQKDFDVELKAWLDEVAEKLVKP